MKSHTFIQFAKSSREGFGHFLYGFVAIALFAGVSLHSHAHNHVPTQAAPKGMPALEDPVAEFQGLWYAINEKVTIEVKGNVVTVVENNSKRPWPTNAGLKSGLVIARLGPHAYARGYLVFPGECWTYSGSKERGFILQKCPEVAYVSYASQEKPPYWTLNLANLKFLRKKQIAQFESGRE